MMHWGTFKYFLQQVTKKFIQKIHLHVKMFFGKKNLQSFSKVISLAYSYRF
jgi:hypothetical protein